MRYEGFGENTRYSYPRSWTGVLDCGRDFQETVERLDNVAVRNRTCESATHAIRDLACG